MTVKFSHLNFLCHHEIFPQFKAKKGDVSSSDYLKAALTGELWSVKTVLQGSLNQHCPITVFCWTIVCSSQFLPEVTWKNTFSKFKISVSQHMYRKHLFST